MIPIKIRAVKANRSFPDNFFIHISCLPITSVNIGYRYVSFISRMLHVKLTTTYPEDS